ncbi:MAG TPA: hypothetical protein VNQ90_15070 [Chthoniobacteraceae bacterium]|nr:hypothetical protein [Chthoniobacteraceae bacterium]
MNPNLSNLLTLLPKTFYRLFRTSCVVGLFLGIALSPGHSQTLLTPDYVENFDGESGLPAGWAAYGKSAAFVVEQNGDGQLDVNSKGATGNSGRGSAFFTGDSTIVDGIVEDAIIEVVLTPTTSTDWVGVVGRAQGSASFEPDGYYAMVNHGGKMGIWSKPPTGNGTGQTNPETNPNILGSTDISLQGNTPYRLILEMAGTQLTASLYGLDAVVGVDAPLAMVSVSDASYSSGVTGVSATFGNYGPTNGRSAPYDSFSLTVIPEPSTAVLGALALGIGFLVLRAGRRSGTVIG